MPSVPEFLLRKLYVPGSLSSLQDGFSFILNDTLVAVTISGFTISADGAALAAENLFLQIEGSKEINSNQVSEEQPLQLSLNVPLTIRAVTQNIKPKILTIEANSKEIGLLRFSLDFRSRGLDWVKPFKKISEIGREWSKRSRVKKDPHHPIYHFTPPANWMNDPNGLVYWQGQHHLFYQHNPQEAVWGNIHWGHAVSPDLVHWKRLPIALTPSEGKPDQDGCWSGSAFMEDDTLRFFYTGVFPESVCAAFPGKGMKKLERAAHNPIIPGAPSGLKVEGFRDPVVWKEADGYYMTVGCGIAEKGGAVLLFRSGDLQTWEYLYPILSGDSRQTKPLFTGSIWECPQLFRIGSLYMLILSVYHVSKLMYSIAYLGEYRDHRFHAKSVQKIDHGEGAYYAPQSFIDHKGRRVLFGWVMEGRSETVCQRAGWAGALSLPRILTIDQKGHLHIEPVPEIDLLHQGEAISFEGILSEQFSPIAGMMPIRNHEIDLELSPGKDSLSGIRLAADEVSDEFVEISYDQKRSILTVETHYGVCDADRQNARREVAVEPGPEGKLNLKVFLDGSVIEIYAEKAAALTIRFYPDHRKKLITFGFSKGQVSAYSLKIWRMRSCFHE